MSSNFGDFQLGVYNDAVKGVNSRFPFDFRSIERKAAETLPDWPLGHYQGVTDQVQMSKTPGYYDPVLVPLDSCYQEWR